jgi:protoporphyrinogen IX oxidase
MLHIVGFVSWFAGLFYLVRLFVYHVEAKKKEGAEILIAQFSIMEVKLYKIIMNPALIITWAAGIAMIAAYGMEWLVANHWLHLKLLLLILLTLYHGYCGQLVKGKKNLFAISSFQFRMLNEVPTVFLVMISSLAVYKNGINYVYLALGVSIFIALLVWGLYKSKKNIVKRQQSEE